MAPFRTFPRRSLFWADQIDDDGDGGGDGGGDGVGDGVGDCFDDGDDRVDDSDGGDDSDDDGGVQENENGGGGERHDGPWEEIVDLDNDRDHAPSDGHAASGELDSIFARSFVLIIEGTTSRRSKDTAICS